MHPFQPLSTFIHPSPLHFTTSSSSSSISSAWWKSLHWHQNFSRRTAHQRLPVPETLAPAPTTLKHSYSAFPLVFPGSHASLLSSSSSSSHACRRFASIRNHGSLNKPFPSKSSIHSTDPQSTSVSPDHYPYLPNYDPLFHSNGTVVHVVSYNVLSSSLSSPSYFTHCDPAHLNPNARLKKVIEKLQKCVQNSAIISLQEVSLAWSGELYKFFQDKGYYFVYASYGYFANGYMGVGLAYPLKKYSSQEIQLIKLASSKFWPTSSLATSSLATSSPGPIKKLLQTWDLISDQISSFSSLIINGSLQGPTIQDPIQFAKRRENVFIFAKLRCKETNKSFCVGGYHMPCAYFLPPVMVIHTALVAKKMIQLANSSPFILAGDFNFTPNDPCYELITTGKIDPKHAAYPKLDGADNWTPKFDGSMKSAYKDLLGSEPDFTNFAQVKDDPPFIETIDYIFVSKHWKVQDVISLNHRSDVERGLYPGPYPNQVEPSDHIIIGSTLVLQ